MIAWMEEAGNIATFFTDGSAAHPHQKKARNPAYNIITDPLVTDRRVQTSGNFCKVSWTKTLSSIRC